MLSLIQGNAVHIFTYPLPPFPLEVGPLISSYGICGSAVTFPSAVSGGVPAEIEFGAYLAVKYDIW